MNEANIMKSIQLALGKLPHIKLFRNNSGQGWVGRSKRLNGSGNVLIEDARPLHAGLCDGSSDLIGWTEITITPDMVGKRAAIFTALEVKTDTGRVTPQQVNFINNVAAAGGIGGIVKTPEGADNIIRWYKPR